tara:strand:+ start:381 stop:605 length:225 start_codon:yes stop_codon:yes gene_type:complete
MGVKPKRPNDCGINRPMNQLGAYKGKWSISTAFYSSKQPVAYLNLENRSNFPKTPFLPRVLGIGTKKIILRPLY